MTYSKKVIFLIVEQIKRYGDFLPNGNPISASSN